MADLSTKYLGLDLRNPIIVGSSSLTGKLENIKKSEDAGAGAVVLKSIFEEQILAETHQLEQTSETDYHVEAWGYLERMGRELSIANYLELIENAKRDVEIPIIASVHCISSEGWLEYAKKVENSGADALELNVYIVPTDTKTEGKKIEEQYFELLEKVKEKVGIPIALKLAPYFSNFLHFAEQLTWRKVDGLVIFNRYYPFDMDIDKLDLKPGKVYSSPDEISLPLRWISLMYDRIECDLSATTGVHDASGVIKQLLAGATTVQMASTLYENGIEEVGNILKGLESWMEEKGFESVEEFRGKLSQRNSKYPELYDRVQFIKAVVGIS